MISSKKKTSNLTHISKILPFIVNNLEVDTHNNWCVLMENWPTIIGSLQEKVKLVSLKKTTLILQVDNAAIHTEINMQKRKIVDNINNFFKKKIIQNIYIKR